MTPARQSVLDRVVSAKRRYYVLRFRHPVFEDNVSIRRDRRGHLVFKLNGDEISQRDLPETVKTLFSVLDPDELVGLWIEDDRVEVHTPTARVWAGGSLNNRIKSTLTALGDPMLKAA